MKYLIAFALIAAVSAGTPEQDIPIVRQDSDVSPDGSWNYVYETGHGIVGQAQGILKNAGQKEEASEVSGSFEYKGDDGVHYAVRYIANELGYQPEGAHLPTAPPAPEIPHYIQRALDWIAAHPQQEERPGKKF